METENNINDQQAKARNNVLDINSIAGTRDFPPQKMAQRNWLFEIWTNSARKFCLEQYDACVIEKAELWQRKAGDDVTKEMFTFRPTNGQLAGQLLCLRPEMTPSLSRISLGTNCTETLRWFSIPQCFRNESVSSTRKIEHYQLNCDIVNGETKKTDAEILALVVDILKSLGFSEDEVTIRVSHRQILEAVFKYVGIRDDNIPTAFVEVDRIAKLTQDEFRQRLITLLEIDDAAVDVILELAAAKTLSDLDAFASKIQNTNSEFNKQAFDDSMNEIRTIMSYCESHGIQNWIQFDASIVRGLSYYTGMVFEGFANVSGINRALCGGGRYDNLTEIYSSSKKMPAVGFGMGDVVIMEVLEKLGRLPKYKPQVDYCVLTIIDKSDTNPDRYYRQALEVSSTIRLNDKSCLILNNTFRQALKRANEIGAKFIVIIGDSELKSGTLTIKNMTDGTQVNVKINEFVPV